ncbi:MAG: hypothetical protein JXA67_02885 [Micromonosporaceae bacterium]|nr:hypothetical protein [Micromonosporaceae bacterium]
MGGWITDLTGSLFEAIVGALTSATMAGLNWILGLLSASVFSSPDVTALPQVSFVATRAQLVANACLVLIVTVAGMLAMTGGGPQQRYSLKALLPRMLTAFLAANMATPLVRVILTSANALTVALTADTFASSDAFAQLRRVIVGNLSDPATAILAAVLRTLALAMLLALIVTWLGRLTVLLVTAGTAPVALLCYALPQTELVTQLWWRSLLGALATQVLQALTLHLAVATLLAPDANLPALGLPHDPTGLLNILITCFVLWLVIRIPAWVARTIGGSPGRGVGVLGSVVRVVVVQRLLGTLGLRGGRRVPLRHPTTAAPRPPARHQHDHQHTGGHQHVHQHLHVHPPRDRQPQPGSRRSSGGQRPLRVPSWVGQPTGRPAAGRPPLALESRPVPPLPPARRAIGPS